MMRDTPAQSGLQIEAVNKSFGTFHALRDIHLDVRKGELLCLLGPSGCGKTTLLRLIAGLEKCENGRILQDGRDITSLPAARRDYGIVFQSYALFPNLTVVGNIGYGLRGREEDKTRRINELLDLIGLPGIADHYPSQLSGGQQQRVALARALAISPSLLLLDEPLSALDARVREHLRGELKSLQQKLGVTTVMVTHDQEEAMGMADRIVVMDHGVIEQIGTPDEIYHRPASEFVAGFVGRGNWLTVTAQGAYRVMLGARELTVECERELQAGETCRLFIRPEQVRLLPPEKTEERDALGRIKSIELWGGFYRLNLSVPQWELGNLEAVISQEELSRLRYADGQLVPLALPTGRLRCFAGEGRV